MRLYLYKIVKEIVLVKRITFVIRWHNCYYVKCADEKFIGILVLVQQSFKIDFEGNNQVTKGFLWGGFRTNTKSIGFSGS